MVANPQQQGWGPPCAVPKVTLVRADGLRLPVHAALADLTTMLLDLTELAGYDVLPGQTWGGLCREVADGGSWSWHAWWMADDLNAPANPRATAEWHRRNARGTKPFGLQIVCDIPEKVIRLWEDYHYGWLGRAKSKPDPMHFQYQGTPADARADTARLRQWIADNGSTPPAPLPIPTPPPVQEDTDMPTLFLVADDAPPPGVAQYAPGWYLVNAGNVTEHPIPAGKGLTALLDSTIPQKGIRQAGWAILRPMLSVMLSSEETELLLTKGQGWTDEVVAAVEAACG